MFLLVRLLVSSVLSRQFELDADRATTVATATALILLIAAGGAQTLLARPSNGASDSRAAQRAFQRWQVVAIPLLVRYKHAIADDASSRSGSVLVARVEQARRRLVALEPAVRQLSKNTPSELRQFMPLLARAVTLAASAQGRYESARAAHGQRSRPLLLQADRLLRRSQRAMAAFSFGVNGVGARLTSG